MAIDWQNILLMQNFAFETVVKKSVLKDFKVINNDLWIYWHLKTLFCAEISL